MGEVKQLLSTSRLVTLTGAGGSGKTRLALRTGAQLQRAFPDGVWFVDLTSLRPAAPLVPEVPDPDELAHRVTTTLGAREQPGGGPPITQLVGYLTDRQALLLLDNCEHLLPACAMLTNGEFLDRCIALYLRGLAAWRRGESENAAALERESLRLRRTCGFEDRFGMASCLETLGWTMAG